MPRVAVVGWDGLRPDLIDETTTPTLSALRARAFRFPRARSVYPSETRPNNATIGTGAQPGAHGITANHMFAPDVVGHLNTGNPSHLLAIGQRHGRVVLPLTLGEVLASGGRRLAVFGSGSPGQTLLQNPHGAGWTVNRAFRIPVEIDALLPPIPAGDADRDTVDRFLQTALLDVALARLDPDVCILWSSEPDGSLHAHGLGSPEVRAALRRNDDRLALLLDRLDLNRTTLLFLSDHGHASVRPGVSVRAELERAGLANPAQVEVTAAGRGIHLRGAARARLPRIAAWLAEQTWCGPIFARDDLPSADFPATVAPASSLWGGAAGRWVPDLFWSPSWGDEPNLHGVPGWSTGDAASADRLQSDHGALSPWEMGNVMFAIGAGVSASADSSLPASPADIAPTILHLLGCEQPTSMTGRPLREAFGGATSPESARIISRGGWGVLRERRVGTATYVDVARD